VELESFLCFDPSPAASPLSFDKSASSQALDLDETRENGEERSDQFGWLLDVLGTERKPGEVRPGTGKEGLDQLLSMISDREVDEEEQEFDLSSMPEPIPSFSSYLGSDATSEENRSPLYESQPSPFSPEPLVQNSMAPKGWARWETQDHDTLWDKQKGLELEALDKAQLQYQFVFHT
jgi:hypothetical protein